MGHRIIEFHQIMKLFEQCVFRWGSVEGVVQSWDLLVEESDCNRYWQQKVLDISWNLLTRDPSRESEEYDVIPLIFICWRMILSTDWSILNSCLIIKKIQTKKEKGKRETRESTWQWKNMCQCWGGFCRTKQRISKVNDKVKDSWFTTTNIR